MAHYAYIDDNNKVVQIFVGKDETVDAPEGFADWEAYQENFKGMKCRRFSYNTKGGVHHTENADGVPVPSDDQSKAFRGNAPAVGWNWDEDNEIFYNNQPHDSWTLNTSNGVWEPPIAFPDDGNDYEWNELNYQNDTADPKTEGWVLYPEDNK